MVQSQQQYAVGQLLYKCQLKGNECNCSKRTATALVAARVVRER